MRQAQQTLELTAQAQRLQQNLQNAHTLITAAAEDNAAYHTVLSSPPLLAQYTTEFFGPGGPGELPAAPAQETPRDRLAAEVAYGEASGRMLPPRGGVRMAELNPAGYGQPQGQPQYAQAPQYQAEVQPRYLAEVQPRQLPEQAPAPQAQPFYQRPQLEVQPPGQGGATDSGAILSTFFAMMDSDPRAAAVFYSQNQAALPQALMSRQFLGEN